MIRRAVILLAAPALVGAQARQQCVWDSPKGQVNVKTASGQFNTFLSGPVTMRCPAKQVTLTSDSLEYYADDGRVFVLGHVHYAEPRLKLDSDYLTYYQKDERVIAQGNVYAQLENGSTLRGPAAEYFRATPGVRPVARLHATGRPTITLVQKDSTGQPSPPTTVLANGVTMLGDSLVYAGGAVIVTREDIVARGDSMDLDSEREVVVMMRNPAIEGRRERPYKLSGARIVLTSKQRKLERVLSTGAATATSEDMTLASDTIDLRVANDLLQHAYAWGKSRAKATSSAQSLVADSIEVLMPDQRLREMRALRGASAEGKPDSVRFRADTLDWMRGDTIIARFDTAAAVARDTTTRATRLRELVARGSAKSYYHLAPADTSLRLPAINYVTGREIIVSFEDGRVKVVNVIEKAVGLYAEPNARALSAAASDSSAQRRTPTQPAKTKPPR